MRWHGQSVCVVASGPSLKQADVDYARAHLDRVITVNESWRMCINADVAYGADPDWWLNRAPDLAQFSGECWTQSAQWKGRQPSWLHTMESKAGRVIAPPGSDYIHTGSNSGFQALGLAVVWGASFVVLLGLDLGESPDGQNHWHADYPEPLRNVRTSYHHYRRAFEEGKTHLAQHGVTVVNASRASTLESYPRVSIVQACAMARGEAI